MSDQWAQGMPWLGAEGVGNGWDWSWCLCRGMSLRPSSWLSLLRHQLIYLQIDSSNIRYRQYTQFPSIQALSNTNSDNNTFLRTSYEFNALKKHNNPVSRFYYNHNFTKEAAEAQKSYVTCLKYIDSK